MLAEVVSNLTVERDELRQKLIKAKVCGEARGYTALADLPKFTFSRDPQIHCQPDYWD